MTKNVFVKNYKIVIVFFFILLLSACDTNVDKKTIIDKLKSFDEKIGQEMDRVDVKDATISSNKKDGEDNNVINIQLSDEEKQKIDNWLSANDLNRYGDSDGVVYPTGSPLFNSETGESIERFEYILKRYPDILK